MKKILIIEDDPFVTDIYTNKLQKEGFLIEVATDGQMGLEKLKNEKYDLLLLDVVLPQIDGWEILRKIKNDPSLKSKTKDLKIVVLSNLNQKEEVKKGIELGATRYFIKAHYTPSEVVAEITQLLK